MTRRFDDISKPRSNAPFVSRILWGIVGLCAIGVVAIKLMG